MGMAPMAVFMKRDGYSVSGFDDVPNPKVREWLESENIDMGNSHAGEKFDDFVISTALCRRLKELEKLLPPPVKIRRRGEVWAQICAKRRLCAVVGSHGKSTVSSLMAHAVLKRGISCGYLVGAIPNLFPMSGYCSEGNFLISEIDESDGTIEMFSPEVLVALNADLDHHNTYADEAELRKMFERLFSRTSRKVLYPASDPMLADIASGFGEKCVPIKTSGDFNLSNREMAAAGLSQLFGSRFGLEDFEGYGGLERRQETLADSGKIFAVADYAHHPTEVESFIKYFESRHESPRVIFFQPHRYSRTKAFAARFAKILSNAAAMGDEIYILPVYAASEAADSSGTSKAVVEAAPKGAIKDANAEDIPNIIENSLNKNKGKKLNAAFIGAGDFYFSVKSFIKNYE